MQKTILYLWQQPFPWDVRTDKICSALADAGHRVIVLARWGGEETERERIKNFEVIRVGFRQPSYFSLPTSLNPFWRKKIHQAIEEFSPDLVMPREILLAEAAESLARKKKIPVIIDMAEHYPAAMRSWKKYSENFLLRLIVHKFRYPDIVERNSVRDADGIITVCEEQNFRLNKQYNFPFEKIEIVYNTPDKNWFSDVKRGSQVPPTVFAHHGFMTPERGLDVLIKAFDIAEKKNPDIRLVLAGDGESMPDLRKIAENISSREKITFTGKYSHSELISMYSETDIGVLAYKTDEFRNHTIPNKVFDYMACGKPVIVSKAIPLARIVEETNSGIAVDCANPESLAEAMLKIRSMNLETFSSNGEQTYQEKYNWEQDSRKLVKFVEKYFS